MLARGAMGRSIGLTIWPPLRNDCRSDRALFESRLAHRQLVHGADRCRDQWRAALAGIVRFRADPQERRAGKTRRGYALSKARGHGPLSRTQARSGVVEALSDDDLIAAGDSRI